MQPLGPPELAAAYFERIASSHDYWLTAEVLDMEQRILAPAKLVDGQINFLAESSVRRTANVTLLDPGFGLGLDSRAPFQGALFADRMIRIKHHVEVPGFGTVACTPIIGPIQDLERDGAVVNLEVHDKTALAILGSKPYTVRKGMNAVSAIRAILANCTGERFFRFPAGSRDVLNDHYSVGWKDEASPWAVASRIARRVGMALFYSCDGYATLRPRVTQEVFEFTAVVNRDDQTRNRGAGLLTSPIVEQVPFADVVNYARATAGKHVRSAIAPRDHPLYPGDDTHKGLSRNGVPRYLPSLADLNDPGDRPKKGRKMSKAQAKKYAQELEKWEGKVTSTVAKLESTASSLVTAGIAQTEQYRWSAVPVFHLDVDDPVRLTVPGGSTVLPLSTATIPLVSGDMTGGQNRRFKKPGGLRRT